VSGDPGWADREILTAPLAWDAAGRPYVGLGRRSGGAPASAGASVAGFARRDTRAGMSPVGA